MDTLLKPREVAERLAVSEPTVYRWADQKVLPCIRLSARAVRFEPAAVEKFIEERRSA